MLREDRRMNRIAVIHPAFEPRLDGVRRDVLLTAHAMQFARGLAQTGARVRIFTVAKAATPPIEVVGEAWGLHTTHELLARLEAFRPTQIVIEHAPLAYGSHYFVALSAASWARVHGVPAMLAAHPEYGRRREPPDTATLGGIISALPLFATVCGVLCHDAAWARILAQRSPAAASRLELLDDWTPIEPPNILPVDTAAPILLVFDDVADASLSRVLARLRADSSQAVYRAVLLFADAVRRSRVRDTVETAGVADRVHFMEVQTPTELSRAFFAASRVIIAQSRRAGEELRWAHCAAVHGRCAVLVQADGTAAEIESSGSSWVSIAHRALALFDAASLSATALEEHIQEPPVGI